MTIDILIIDDQDYKIDALRQVIAPLIPEDTIVINEAHTIAEGREAMHRHAYDLLILDMVIPELEGENPSHTAGAEFLNELYDNDSVQKPLQIIGLTEYEAEFSEQQADFRDKLWYLLFYSQSKLEWKKMLKNKVLQLAKMKRGFVESLENCNKYDVGIICALSEEYEQLQKAFSGCHWDDCRIPGLPWLFLSTTVATASFKELKVIAVCADSPGVCATSILATALYTVAKVDAVFMTGITAGVEYDDLRLDDVIIAEAVMDYATGKLKEGEDKNGEIKWLREIHQVNASSHLLSCATSLFRESEICDDINHELREKNLKDGRDNVQFRKAKTVCGPFVVASGSLVDVLKRDDRKLQALDMEGFGLYLTAHNLDKQALWIKGVCDFADIHKGDGHHKCCAYVSAAFLYQLLREKY